MDAALMSYDPCDPCDPCTYTPSAPCNGLRVRKPVLNIRPLAPPSPYTDHYDSIRCPQPVDPTGNETADMRMDPLDTAEVFSVVNSMRPLSPAVGTFRVLLSFLPQQRMQYFETLTLHGNRAHIRVALKVRKVFERRRVVDDLGL